MIGYASESSFDIENLIFLFAQQFKHTEQTVLVKGDGEPIYLPKTSIYDFHQVVFAHGFFSSAMHELAHWCIAGIERRKLVDYGYWYEPDGRTLDQQLAFAQVEAKPQALEWIFNYACNRRFHISLDNLNGISGDDLPFKQAVLQEIRIYQHRGLPPRALILQKALADFYHQEPDWLRYDMNLEALL
jgi:hypothetical protein